MTISPPEITPDLLLHAYANGVFPMAEKAEDEDVFWLAPEVRGIIPLDGFHLPRKLQKQMRRGGYEAAINRDFAAVIDLCAAKADNRPSTWINGTIRALCLELHKRGHAHSVEIWQDGEIAGGLYGVSLGSAFFGESMFHRRTNASKLALGHLLITLKAAGFTLLDSQFITDHLQQFGAIEINRTNYLRRLKKALEMRRDFPKEVSYLSVQPTSQTS